MGVRNCAEFGENLQKMVKRLMANEDLVKLLYYTDKDPLNHEVVPEGFNTYEEFTKEEVFNKLIKFTPRIGPTETAQSLVTLLIAQASTNENSEFRNVFLQVEVFVPNTQWIIKGTNLRPFAIMGEIQKSLQGKTINGLGKISGGNINFNYVTDEMTCYQMMFSIVTYE